MYMATYMVCAVYICTVPMTVTSKCTTYTVPVHLFLATYSNGSMWCVVASCPGLSEE